MGIRVNLSSAGVLLLCGAVNAFVPATIGLDLTRGTRSSGMLQHVTPLRRSELTSGGQRRLQSASVLRMGAADRDQISNRRTDPTGVTVGIPKEIQFSAVQVAAAPKTVAMLIKSCGYRVLVEAGTGEESGNSDEDYRQAGAQIVDTSSVWAADIVFKVNAPHLEEADLAQKGGLIISYFPPSQKPDVMEKLRERRLSIIAMNNPRLPRTITRTQTFDALFFMANIAGYRGVVEAANAFGRYFAGQQVTGRNEPAYDFSKIESSLQGALPEVGNRQKEGSRSSTAAAPRKVAIIGSGNWGSGLAAFHFASVNMLRCCTGGIWRMP